MKTSYSRYHLSVKYGTSIPIALFVVLFLWQAPAISQGVRQGLQLCGSTVIPSLFCFMVLTNFLIATPLGELFSWPLYPITKCIFRCPPQLGTTILMSFLGGYPIGAKAIAQLREDGKISVHTAKRLLCFCCNPAPSFVITAVGMEWLHCWQSGVLLYSSIALGSILLAVFIPSSKERENIVEKHGAVSWSNAFVNAVCFSTTAVLQMSGFILLFQGMTSLSLALLGKGKWSVLLLSLLEVTTGCNAMCHSQISAALPQMAFFLAFGGFSVIFQLWGFLKNSGVSFGHFVFFRLIHGSLSFLICGILLRLFPQAVPTVLSSPASAELVPSANSNTPLVVLCLIGMCWMLLNNTPQKELSVKR